MSNPYAEKHSFGTITGNHVANPMADCKPNFAEFTRVRFHRAVRLVIREQDEIRMERMATAILQSNHRDLSKEDKKIKGRGNIVAASIHGLSKGKAIICSDNYRAITLNSLLCKVFDWIVLLKENKILRSCDLQFSFKEHASTTQCTFAMNEVISYYNSKGSDVFVVFLDATKAFDRIDFCKLFTKLLDRNMLPLLLRLLLYMYTNQNLVRWGSIAGTKFGACNGVKQGAVLSPILIAVYMDDLCSQLRDSGSGCHIDNHYVGSLGYADDTVLMAPSLKGLQTIVDVGVNYARKHDVIYNGSKSQFLIFPSNSGSHVKRHISIDENVLQSVNEAVHLGHHVSVINKDCMLQHAISHSWRSFNIFRADFCRLYPEVQCDLFITYCSSFYGAPLWNICSATFKQLCAAWRKCIRKIWRVHPMTHCDVIALLSHCKPMEIGIQQTFCKFVANTFQWHYSVENHCFDCPK